VDPDRPEVTSMPATTVTHPSAATSQIAAVLDALRAVQDTFETTSDPRRHFVATYARTTAAVGDAVRRGLFEDPAWVDRWDAQFARLYLDALTAFESDPRTAPRPWRAAFTADETLPPLRLVLLGMNAHINYDLPQALLAVISDDDFADPELVARRGRDHERIDVVLASRVAAEDRQLSGTGGPSLGRSLLDRALTPLNRAASRRLLEESRRRVWHNARVLQAARVRGHEDYQRVLTELEVLSASRIADLVAPGQVLLKLAAGGFGITLPPD
jgi:hypothetical protein